MRTASRPRYGRLPPPQPARNAAASSTCSGTEFQRLAGLLAGVTAQVGKEFAAALAVAPGLAVELVVEAAGAGGEPHFLQRFLQVDDDLAAVLEGERDHSAHPLVVDVRVALLVDSVAAGLDAGQQSFGAVEVIEVGHYNFQMFGVHQILVSASMRRLALAACGVVLLAACGQKGPLFMPKGEAAAGRATLGDLITPSAPTAPSTAVTVPVGPASSVPGTGRASPITTP